jgi:hypothetical protein
VGQERGTAPRRQWGVLTAKSAQQADESDDHHRSKDEESDYR